MATSNPLKKRTFDFVAASALVLALLPVLLLCAAAILVREGRPVLYRSSRRVYRSQSMRIAKFRTMRRDADKVLNRETVPITGVCFLNIPPDSPAYTPVGRLIERCLLTEMPQLVHVLGGKMSLIGNRPLPENVIAALKAEHPNVEDRFLVPTGLTGPVQLIGRDAVSDHDRLRIEIAYCHSVMNGYSAVLDAKILLYTVLGGFFAKYRFTPDQVIALLAANEVRPADATAQNLGSFRTFVPLYRRRWRKTASARGITG